MCRLKVTFLLLLHLLCNTSYSTDLSGSTVIQIGTYAESMLQVAEKEKAKYIAQGYNAYLVPVLNPTPQLKGKYYRLRIGPFKTVQEATRFTNSQLSQPTIKPWIDTKENDSASFSERVPVDEESYIYEIDTTASDIIIDFDEVDDTIAIEILLEPTLEDSLAAYPKIEPDFYDAAKEALLDSLQKQSRRKRIVMHVTTAVISSGLAAAGYLFNREGDKLYTVYKETQLALPAEHFDAAWSEIEKMDKRRNICYSASGATAGLFTTTLVIGQRKRKREERRHAK